MTDDDLQSVLTGVKDRAQEQEAQSAASTPARSEETASAAAATPQVQPAAPKAAPDPAFSQVLSGVKERANPGPEQPQQLNEDDVLKSAQQKRQQTQWASQAGAAASTVTAQAVKRIASAFGQGVVESAGSAVATLQNLSADKEDLDTYPVKGEDSWQNSINTVVMRSLIQGSHAGMKALGAGGSLFSTPFSAVAAAIQQTGEESDNAGLQKEIGFVTAPETAFALGIHDLAHVDLEGLRAHVPMEAIRDFVEKPPLPPEVARAVDNGLVTPTDPSLKIEAAQTTAAMARAQRMEAQKGLVTSEVTPGLHDIVRQDNPELFDTYDRLTPQLEEARSRIHDPEIAGKEYDGKLAELKAQREENLRVPVHLEGTELDEAVQKSNARDAEIAAQIKELGSRNKYIADSKEEAQTKFQQLDNQLRDITPDVNKAYVEATPKAKEAAFSVPAEAKTFADAAPAEAEQPKGAPPAFDIAADVKKKLSSEGRTKEQAEHESQIIAARYETAAAKGWAPGSAAEIYQKHMAEIKATKGAKASREALELAQPSRGNILLASKNSGKAVIKLFKKNDASTLMHEMAHHWLDEMTEWEKAVDAPRDLKDHMQAVRDWLGADKGDFSGFTSGQHEKWARGFERYLREGVAPSAKLANAFAHFKDWLSKIYDTAAKLKVEISPAVRDVFDHMLAVNPERITIADEHAPAKAIADIHEADAKSTPPEHADAVGDTVAREVDTTTKIHDPEVADVIKDAEQTSSVAAEASSSAGNGAAAGESPGEGGVAKEPEPVATGGGGLAEQGGESRAEPAAERGGTTGDEKPIRSKSVDKLVDKAGNVVVSNLDTSDEVEAALHTVAQNTPYLDHDVVSDAKVGELGRDLGVKNPDAVLDKLRSLSDKSGVPLAAYIHAARQMLRSATREAIDFAAKVKGGTEEDFLNAVIAKDRFLLLATTLSKATNEIGRAMRAFHNLKGMDAMQLQELFQKTGSSREDMEALFQTIASKDTDNLRDQIPSMLQQTTKAGYWEKAAEHSRCAILSNYITHGLWLAGTAVNVGLYKPLIVDTLRGLENEIGKRFLGKEDTGSRVYGGIEGLVKTITQALPSILSKTGTALTEQKTVWRPGHGEFEATQGSDARKTLGVDKEELRKAVEEAFVASDQTKLDELKEQVATAEDTGNQAKAQKLRNKLDAATQEHVDAITERIATEMSVKMKSWREMMEDLHHFGAAAAASFSTGLKERMSPEFYDGKSLIGTKYSDGGSLPDITVKGLNILPYGSVMRGTSNVIYSTMHTFAREFAANVDKTQIARRIAVRENNEAVKAGREPVDVTKRMAELFNSPTEEMLQKQATSATRQTLMSNSSLTQDPHLVAAKEIANQESKDAAKNKDAEVDVSKRTQELLANPTDLMLAKVKALKARNSRMSGSNFAQKLTSLRSSFDEGTGTKIANILFPVISVPMEATHQTVIDSSPLGLISKTMRSKLANEEGTEEGERARAEMLAGTALLALGAWQYTQGNVTNSESVNYSQEEQRKKEGRQSNSVRMGDFMVSVTHTAKIGTLLVAGADLMHIFSVYRGEDMSDKLKPAIQSAVNNLFLHENPMVSGSDMLDALRGKSGIENYLKNFAVSRIVPQFIKATDDLSDPTVRESKSFMSALLSKIPEESDNLAPKISALDGEPIEKSPAHIHSALGDPIAQSLSDIYIHPANPRPEISGIQLNPQQLSEYSSVKGHILHNGLQDLMLGEGKDDYDRADVTGKRSMVQKRQMHASNCAKSYMFNKYPELLKDANDKYEADCANELQ